MKEDGVIKEDVCTDAQIKVMKLRAERGPVTQSYLDWRRAGVNPRFFEEVRPVGDKDTAVAEMRARWANDKASAARQYEDVAQFGATFVVWPIANERCWPKPASAWVRHCKWFAMWRASRRAAQAE